MRFCHYAPKSMLAGLYLVITCMYVTAQTCPDNIDFEKGNFDGWTCYTGNVTGNGLNQINLSPGDPIPERHTMYTSYPGNGLDYYGNFPINCPNGSGHSIRLGNSMGGGQAEGISYEFTIPSNENYYTLIYNYAVVFQDPNHEVFQQPRLEIEVLNVTDNTIIYCSSFTFIPYGNILPGFFESSNPGSETPVWCKDWTAVSINLDGHAGKEIRLFFKTADCTFQRHFGYAYIDVNSECSGTFTGATFCPDDAYIHVVAPFGYQNYTWFNSGFSQVLGSTQVLTIQPPPPSGTTVAVQLTPYDGYGCPDTLFARLIDTLTVTANAGPDSVSCNHNPVPLGHPPRPGLIYQWTPAAGLSNSAIANPWARPDTNTTYILTANHDGGGCVDRDTVVVRASVIADAIQLLGKATYCLGSGDSAVLRVAPTDSIQWYRDGTAIVGATRTEYHVTQSGSYHALLFNHFGCSVPTARKEISIATTPVAALAPTGMVANQCLVGNVFNFVNASTNAVGPMRYRWVMGNGDVLTSRDVSYSFPLAGEYTVKLIVNSSDICADSAFIPVTVYQNAIADFDVKPICIELPLTPNNKTVDTLGSTINYTWDFGNGNIYYDRTPPPQVYLRPGNFPVSLSVNTEQCPAPLNTLKKIIVVEKPAPPVTYPVRYAVIGYPLELQARQIGVTALWQPSTFLDDPAAFKPVFMGPDEQRYSIKITTGSGCVTIDTQLVTTVKEAAIYVPNAFTPNNDGLNDFLRPVLMGVREIRYFRIFNRWGRLLYQSQNETPGWDGTNGGTALASQVVVWMIEGITVDQRTITMKGTSTLLR